MQKLSKPRRARKATSFSEPDLFSLQATLVAKSGGCTPAVSQRPPSACIIGESSAEANASHRLFVPLSSAPFLWFRSGKKTWELRNEGRQYTTKHVRPGRTVELRKGYSGKEALWGTVCDVICAMTIRDFFRKVPFAEVIPTASSTEDAVEIAESILRTQGKPVIGFNVVLHENAHPSR